MKSSLRVTHVRNLRPSSSSKNEVWKQERESLNLIIWDWSSPLSILCHLAHHSTSAETIRHRASSADWFLFSFSGPSHSPMQKPETIWCKGSSQTSELEGAAPICHVNPSGFFFFFLVTQPFQWPRLLKPKSLTQTCRRATRAKHVKHNSLRVQKQHRPLARLPVDVPVDEMMPLYLDAHRSQRSFQLSCHLSELMPL